MLRKVKILEIYHALIPEYSVNFVQLNGFFSDKHSMNKKIFILSLIFMAGEFCFADTIFKSNAVASYYADKFHGRKTSSGEIFNMHDFTAAHKSLPFGTRLKVTNLANGESVTVRVNDRGPFVAGREIDLSKAAAEKLDMIRTGTANVSITVLDSNNPGTSTVAATPKTAPEAKGAIPVSNKVIVTTVNAVVPSGAREEIVTEEAATAYTIITDKKWDIQLGSFTVRAYAEELAQKLLREGFTNVVYQKTSAVTRVVIADISTADVQRILDTLDRKGFKDYFVKERKL